jgi:hypothetical protein
MCPYIASLEVRVQNKALGLFPFKQVSYLILLEDRVDHGSLPTLQAYPNPAQAGFVIPDVLKELVLIIAPGT